MILAQCNSLYYDISHRKNKCSKTETLLTKLISLDYNLEMLLKTGVMICNT